MLHIRKQTDHLLNTISNGNAAHPENKQTDQLLNSISMGNAAHTENKQTNQSTTEYCKQTCL